MNEVAVVLSIEECLPKGLVEEVLTNGAQSLLDWTVILTIFVQTTSGLLSLDYHLITIKCRSKIANLYCILLFCAPNSKTKQVGLVFHQK